MLYLPSCICSAWAGAKSEIANNNERSTEMAKKKASKNIPIPILILICATVLLYAIYTSVSTLALAIWGDSVMGTVDSYKSRLDDTNGAKSLTNRFKGYWFIANGKEYRGYVRYSSDEAWPSLDEGETRSERIRYLKVLPYVNKPAMLSEFSEMGEGGIFTSFLPIGCLLFAAACHTNSQRWKEETGGEEARRISNYQAKE